ncbi:oligoendopeptidase F [Granulicatella sp. zg-ZJ]|uniref:oligoendopeptidase F n=1 Tax=Granulicatella sp. zg-ZJ TaxID=2678504 RepID=UPI0013D13E03|nr:oligoendopeptidase F [Granulicatella sp. zg-ZJ]NEW63255.1 oligoendopeptidase F [Granulicatella sp. zg-ZJ]
MAEQVKRHEIEEALTWDLTLIFKSDEEQEKEVAALEQDLDAIKALKGTLGSSAESLLNALQTVEKFERRIEVAYIYAHLKADQDTANGKYQAMFAKTYGVYVKFAEATAPFTPELLEIPEETLESYFGSNSTLATYRHFFERLTSKRAYTLSEKEEALLAGSSEVMEASGDIAAQLMNADLKHGEVTTEDGTKQRLTNGLYAQLLESNNRALRQEAYNMMFTTFGSVKNTLASTLSTTVKGHNYNARIRGYKSARQEALSSNFVPEEVYDTLVKVVNDKLPIFQRYLNLRKKVLGLETLNMYDVYTPLVEDVDVKYTIEQAKETTLKALAPLGEEYLSVLERAFDERWIDWIENEGKRTGAYSSGSYDTAPYILMNWRDSIDQLYTLVHELGHSMHSYFTHQAQNHTYGKYPIFLAEIASTTNENLLTEYLLKTETDPRVRQYVINHYLDGVKGTVFRQTQFAEFEHFMHEQDAAGVPLTHEFLTQAYAELNAKYYAVVEQDDKIALEWARIPHFYYNYYVFQYATGFSAASALAARILTGNQEYIDQYFYFLKAGESAYPIDVMKHAGVDMTQSTYIEEALAVFEQRLEELEQLLG